MILNVPLFALLLQRFGDVQVSDEGEEFVEESVPSQPSRPSGQDFPKVRQWGEWYTVCCRKCGDTNYQLFVHHTFPQRHWLLKCFSRDCYRDMQKRALFHSTLFRGRSVLDFEPTRGN